LSLAFVGGATRPSSRVESLALEASRPLGILREIRNGKELVLAVKQTFGRKSHCTVRLSDRWVAPWHAELRWDGEAWIIRDFASTNGTFVDGARLSAGQPHALQQGNAIGFGRASPDFELVDGSGP
jgi:pSer/pThr/pTyr-binding forkhead associated (FHA) protein